MGGEFGKWGFEVGLVMKFYDDVDIFHSRGRCSRSERVVLEQDTWSLGMAGWKIVLLSCFEATAARLGNSHRLLPLLKPKSCLKK